MPALSSSLLGLQLLSVLIDVNAAAGLWANKVLSDSRAQYQHRAEASTQNRAQALDQTLIGSIEKINLALQSGVSELEQQLRSRSTFDEPRATSRHCGPAWHRCDR